MHSTLEALTAALPENWLSPYKDEYLTLLEKTLYSIIQLKAAELKFGEILESTEDYSAFFASEAKRLDKSPEAIRGFFYQIAEFKAKEKVFEDHYSDLVARDEHQNPVILRRELEHFVHQAQL